MQAVRKKKTKIVVCNSQRRQPSWLPDYMSEYADLAEHFWIKTEAGNIIGNYEFIKQQLGA